MVNINRKIVKYNDKIVLSLLAKVSEESGILINTFTLFPTIGGNAIPWNTGQTATPDLQAIIDANSELIRQFSVLFTNNVNLHIRREVDQPFDNLEAILQVLPDNNRLDGLHLEIALRKNFKFYDSSQMAREILGKELQEHYAFREAELKRLEEIAHDLLIKQQQYMQARDDEYTLKRKTLEGEYDSKSNILSVNYRKREEELEKKKEELDTKLKQIDDRESKHVRRKIREDLKEELKSRSQKFELTAGTRKLRQPIFWFSLILLAIFGAGFIFFSVYSFLSMIKGGFDLGNAEVISILVKQIVFAVAFGSTSVFYIRWNNRWFEKHSDEEFKLKRYEIDLDRASWLAEMAFEWKKEKGEEIPTELIERLSRNLFAYEEKESEPLHPSEQLAEAILGAASSVSLKVPGGAEVHLDRKSIKALDK